MIRRAIVIGSGPNGLTAAIVLAKAGVKTTLLEAQPTIGGATRSAAWTLPGFMHDTGSAVHPLAVGSPILSTFPLAAHGLRWIHSPSALAHPFEDGSSLLLDQSLLSTEQRLGNDGARYRSLIEPLASHWPDLARDILGPLRWPRHPLLLARFGMLAPWSAAGLSKVLFKDPRTRALFAGLAAHSTLPLEKPFSAGFGWVLGLTAHAVGWPIPQGGSQSIANALASYFKSLGGEIIVNQTVGSLGDLSEADVILGDLTPRQALRVAGDRFPKPFINALQKYRYGPGAFKVDWALRTAIPWRSPDCARAATVHVGGTLGEISDAERAPWENRTAERPFVLLAQPSLFDSSRAPTGQHTAWAYCHVPNGSTVDMTDAIESQIERMAPGFKKIILAKHVMSPAALEGYNANLVGGDINGGVQDFNQLFLRPTRQMYRTPIKGFYLCSSSTPPGGGVHGMCGYHAATAALEDFR